MQVRSIGALVATTCALAFPTGAWGLADPSGCLACGGCGGFFLFWIALLALNIAILVWVVRDAKARGMDSAVLWLLLIFFTGPIGLIVYILARPQGPTAPCPNCGNKRLQASVKCPHCGVGS